MRWDSLYIGGLGSYLPSTLETAVDAVTAGRLTPKDLEKSRQVSAAVGQPNESAPAMAVHAGRIALEEFNRNSPPEASPELIVHAVALHTGLEAWNGGAYIGNELDFPETLAIEIRNTCAGSIVGIDLLATRLGTKGYGLLTASDVWRLPTFDRWATDSGLAYGDAGAAIVLSRSAGPFQVLSTALTQNSRFERMHRGNALLDLPEYREPLPFSMRARSGDYARTYGLESFWKANAEGLQRSVDQALDDAGIDHAAVRAWSIPHFGETLLRRQCLEPLGLEPKQTTSRFGSQIGHTGAADPLLGLQYLRRESAITPGDHIALIGIGAGFTWGCAVLRYHG